MGTYRLRVPASRVGYVPEAQGGLPRAPRTCTYGVRVPASGVGYVPRTVPPQVLPGNELDHTERRDVGMHADAAGGRLRDSTARFFCTPQQMPHRQARQQTLEDDGLTTTQRTSTVIGVGLNPAAEIKSIGVRENFTESVYAIRRRNSNMDPRTALGRANLRQASQANAMQQSASHAAEKARSEDVAMVAALK